PPVPARPATRDSSEDVPLAKQTSAGSVASDDSSAREAPPAPRPKPAIPVRGVGSKISNLKAGFLSDLDKRLQLGPQAPKKDEAKDEAKDEEGEKKPLEDPRKGRARGPTRRRPGKSPSVDAAVDGAESAIEKTAPKLDFSVTTTLWHIDDE